MNPHDNGIGILFACDMGFGIERFLIRHRVFPDGPNTHDQTLRLCPEIQDDGQLLGREVLLGWRFTVRGKGSQMVLASLRFPRFRELFDGGTRDVGKHGRDCFDQGVEAAELALAVRSKEMKSVRKSCSVGFQVAVLFFLLRVAILLSRGTLNQYQSISVWISERPTYSLRGKCLPVL